MTDAPENDNKALWQGVAMGLIASAFFSLTFVLNRQMALASGHWAWSASLRYLMMLPALLLWLSLRRQWPRFIALWRASPWGWIAWGTLGSSVFYGALTAACAVSPAWIVASSWSIAMLIGLLLGPLIYEGERRKIPRRALLFSSVILVGIAFLQIGELQKGVPENVAIGLALVLLSASAHPIGNRMSMKIIEKVGGGTDAALRLTLSIVGALPTILLMAMWGGIEAGLPSGEQLGTVALISAVGLICTPLFFAATDRVHRDPAGLAAVEATQAAELVFTLIFEAAILGIILPDAWGFIGLVLVVSGILLHAIPQGKANAGQQPRRRRTRRSLPLE